MGNRGEACSRAPNVQVTVIILFSQSVLHTVTLLGHWEKMLQVKDGHYGKYLNCDQLCPNKPEFILRTVRKLAPKNLFRTSPLRKTLLEMSFPEKPFCMNNSPNPDCKCVIVPRRLFRNILSTPLWFQDIHFKLSCAAPHLHAYRTILAALSQSFPYSWGVGFQVGRIMRITHLK